jgi:hypothetical protein
MNPQLMRDCECAVLSTFVLASLSVLSRFFIPPGVFLVSRNITSNFVHWKLAPKTDMVLEMM